MQSLTCLRVVLHVCPDASIQQYHEQHQQANQYPVSPHSMLTPQLHVNIMSCLHGVVCYQTSLQWLQMCVGDEVQLCILTVQCETCVLVQKLLYERCMTSQDYPIDNVCNDCRQNLVW